MPDAPAKDPVVAPKGVPSESFADHVVLRPPNRLMQRATRKVGLRDKSDAEAVERAEHALELLAPEFASWMEEELVRLEETRAAMATTRDGVSMQALYRSAHDLRGQSATFGFPLAGEIADGLCSLLEHAEPPAPQTVIDRHVEAIRAIVHENARDRDHMVGAQLVARLAELRVEFLQRKASSL